LFRLIESKEAIGNSEPSKQGNGLPRPAGDCGERSAGAAEALPGQPFVCFLTSFSMVGGA
jgi:hypothetical protein